MKLSKLSTQAIAAGAALTALALLSLGQTIPANKIEKEGVAVELSITGTDGKPKTEPLQGEDLFVRFRITDSRTGAPLTGLHPTAWIDRVSPDRNCRQKVQAFLQGSLSARPEIDLNTYFILTLNSESNISVLDPLLGYGNSKLFTLVFLKSPGEDWVLSADKKKLFVSMPQIDQVAVVDTATWHVTANIDIGARPGRLALQADQKYLWVALVDGVAAIDAAAQKVAARIKTGSGAHEITITPDDQFVFVSNKIDGTLSIIDVKSLAKTKDVKTGQLPASLAFSPLSKTAYVANEGDGTVTAVGGDQFDQVARLTLKPGLKAVRFARNGRWGFVVNGKEDAVTVFDASTNRVLDTVVVGKNPDQLSFTDDFAYVRCAGSDHVYMIQLQAVEKGGRVPVTDIPAGQKVPGTTASSYPDCVVPAPEGGSVLIANPADQMVYYYMEGMAAPMGSFQNYRRTPKAVMVWNKSVTEEERGVYSTSARIPGDGKYEVLFLLDTPRVVHCFDLSVKADPALAAQTPGPPIKIEHLTADLKVKTGQKARLRFRVTDPRTGEVKPELKDLGVLVFSTSNWQQRRWAQSVGQGVYEVEFAAPENGTYYVFLQCPSLKVRLNQLPHIIIEAGD